MKSVHRHNSTRLIQVPTLVSKSCPHCGGQRYTERDIRAGLVTVCINCGRETYLG